MMSWRVWRRLLAAIGCVWLGAPIVVRMWNPMTSLQQLAATPLYALFGVVQVILLACVVGSLQGRTWVSRILLWCALAWTVAVPAWIALSPLGFMSLLMLLSPAGIVGSSAQPTDATAAPVHYAVMALTELWGLALLARAWPAAGRPREPQEATKTPPARWETREIWAGILAAAVHVTIWPTLQRSALSGALFRGQGGEVQIELAPEQRHALSAADQKILLEVNEDLALISHCRPPVHAQTVEFKNSTWYRTRWYEIAALRYEGRVRQIDVMFYSDLSHLVHNPKFFVDWPVRALQPRRVAGVRRARSGLQP